MNSSQIFIIGANGQLGRALKQQYPGASSADITELDITDANSVAGYDWSGVKVIANAAAYTNVDAAETPEGRQAAWQVNSVAVANLARVAQEHGITLVHISTDYVFDGSKELHTETEPFTPLGVYGQSKAAGAIAASLAPQHYILRATWVIGDGKNFVRTTLELGAKGVSPTVVAHQIGRLTFTTELVRAIDHLLTAQAPYGTYNASNGGDSVSWSDITREIFKEAGFANLSVTDTTTAEYFVGKDPAPAPRPLQSTLALDKLKSTGFTPRDWREDLQKYIKKELT